MNSDPQIIITGNLTADPDLRFTASGTAVATFTVAHTPRLKRGDQWEDGLTLFLRCTAWRTLAEHVAQSMQRGDRVTVRGTLRTNEWTDKTTGELRTVIECTANDVAASLAYATATIKRVKRDHAASDSQWTQQEPSPPSGQAVAQNKLNEELTDNR